jgi:hypothetical protein
MSDTKVYLPSGYEWKFNGESFSFLFHWWDVDAAKKLLAASKSPRELGELDPKRWVDFIGRPPVVDENGKMRISLGIALNWKAVQEAPDQFNLEDPVIVGLIPYREPGQRKKLWSPMVIDGWHRMARGLIEQKPVMGILLTEQENKKIYKGR